MTSKISIIIPTLNEEKIIEKVLKSLKDYSGNYEIIISDGKSKDKTIEIAQIYGAKTIIYEGVTRQTIGMGRNLGVTKASGDFYLFLDADMFLPDIDKLLSKALSLFEKNPKLVAITAYIKVLPETATFWDNAVYWVFNRMTMLQNNVLHTGGSPGEFMMMRAEAFKKVNGFNEKLPAGEDFEMFARLSKIGLTRSEPSIIGYHTGRRIHKIGWPKLLYTWFMNWVHATFFKDGYSEIWEEVR